MWVSTACLAPSEVTGLKSLYAHAAGFDLISACCKMTQLHDADKAQLGITPASGSLRDCKTSIANYGVFTEVYFTVLLKLNCASYSVPPASAGACISAKTVTDKQPMLYFTVTFAQSTAHGRAQLKPLVFTNVACADLKCLGSENDNGVLTHFLIPPESLRRVQLKPENTFMSATAESQT